jgi:hypothetical protein
MVCGTAGRPCPKLLAAPARSTNLPSGRVVPPPCIYLFPRSIPDPRNNPNPRAWKIQEITFLKALLDAFHGRADDVTEIHIQARMDGPEVQRKTILKRKGKVLSGSEWTTIKRASR